jgi:cytochrome c biogenesis protein CcdA
MLDLSLIGFALVAGALATVNPCGFVMLPTLVAIQLGQGSRELGGGRIGSAVGFALQATAGFLVVFGLLGLTIAAGIRSVSGLFPVGGLAVGILLLAAGLYGLLARRPLLAVPLPAQVLGRQVGGAAFGVAYAVASLSCTLPIFLAVLGGTLLASGPLAVVVSVVAYALGMGTVLLGVALAAAVSGLALTQRLRPIAPLVDQVGSFALTGVGLYLVVYWARSLGLS